GRIELLRAVELARTAVFVARETRLASVVRRAVAVAPPLGAARRDASAVLARLRGVGERARRAVRRAAAGLRLVRRDARAATELRVGVAGSASVARGSDAERRVLWTAGADQPRRHAERHERPPPRVRAAAESPRTRHSRDGSAAEDEADRQD